MIVTWTTFDATNGSVVEFGISSLTDRFVGHHKLFIDGGNESRPIYIHRVVLKHLIPGTTYMYHCGSTDGWSTVFWFTTMKEGSDWSPRLAVFGDLGNENGQSIPRLQEEVQRDMYDAVLHIGDFAYDMDSDNARVGDQFMRQIEPIAAYVPYQVCPGNHEYKYNFSNYDNRFSMANSNTGSINNHYYSFNIGPAHIISLSTEFYYFIEYGWKQLVYQYYWLLEDLREANKPENRLLRPWIITMGHRPMYCSTEDRDDCTHKECITRKGMPIVHTLGLEDLFYEYGVDLELWAHEHVYERMWPLYDRQVYNGSTDEPYTNPPAPVHIITGSAGCKERHDSFVANPPPWSAIRIADYGYTRIHILNGTHLSLEQVSDDKSGQIVDSITIVQEKHGLRHINKTNHF
ncbi:acid phosphatase type 7-like [Oppia nitens]|uniref:acid phosphatase type 7-like n=1 Tax=Oppia nitens TaxID=1686743 RepID=UPI0023DB939D|nr:acid phosphatase type 7-like [Oppia nitens]